MNDPVEIELYVWTLDVDVDERARLAAHLSSDEIARARRFVFARDHDRFIVARGRMREVLASTLACAPEAVRFSYSSNGKPAVAKTAMRFNLSHSQAIAALGVTLHHEIGVDIEHVRPLAEEDLAGRFFSPRENAMLGALPEPERMDAFFRCWTRKEAVVKAIGEGLSRPLDSFDVSIGADAPPIVERFEGEADARSAWRLVHFEPRPRYAGAVACRTGGKPVHINIRQV